MTNHPKPRTGNFMTTFMDSPQFPRPHYKEVKKDIRTIVSIAANFDWFISHVTLVAYLEAYGLRPNEDLTLEVTNHYLNVSFLRDVKIEEFLDAYCEVYKRGEDAI
jgi:hypothetical protein